MAQRKTVKRQNDEMVWVRIPKKLKQAWEKKATRDGLGVSTWIRKEMMRIHGIDQEGSRAA